MWLLVFVPKITGDVERVCLVCSQCSNTFQKWSTWTGCCVGHWSSSIAQFVNKSLWSSATSHLISNQQSPSLNTTKTLSGKLTNSKVLDSDQVSSQLNIWPSHWWATANEWPGHESMERAWGPYLTSPQLNSQSKIKTWQRVRLCYGGFWKLGKV